MFVLGEHANYPLLAFPEFAPLPTSFVLHMLNMSTNEILYTFQHEKTAFIRDMASFEERFHITKRTISAEIRKLLEQRKKFTLDQFQTAVAQQLKYRTTPQEQISRDTIQTWKREKNILPDLNNYDRRCAILIAAQMEAKERKFLPRVNQDQHEFYCYMLQDPQAVWQPCPLPLSEQLPPGILLWMPWQTFDPDWLPVSEWLPQGALGSIRWSGARRGKDRHWSIPLKDLQRWNPTLKNHRLFGMGGLDERAIHNYADSFLLEVVGCSFLEEMPLNTSNIQLPSIFQWSKFYHE